MQFDEAYFDAGIDRRGTNTIKWDRSCAQHGEDLLPMFIADMDFAGAPAITEALVKRAAHAAYGYTVMMDEDYDALIGFWQRRHGLTFAKEDVLTIPGVVPGINMTIRALTQPGDGVIIQTPVYGPFRMQIEATERKVMEAPLIRREDGGYDMDLAAVEAQCRAGAKLMVLCNPHNPASRAWTREELTALMAVLEKYGVPLAADEIHADFVYAPAVFTPVLSIRRSNVVMLTAPGKTFNLAGLQHASIVCCDADVREKIRHEIHACELTSGNVMALTAARAAYNDCDEWLDGLLAYLRGNIKALEEAVAKYLPKAVLSPIGATYLGWLDLRAYGFDNEELMKRSIGAGVQFNGGTFFGDLGNGFLRINIACPRRNIEEAVKRLAKGLE